MMTKPKAGKNRKRKTWKDRLIEKPRESRDVGTNSLIPSGRWSMRRSLVTPSVSKDLELANVQQSDQKLVQIRDKDTN